ncbi:MAG: hypothetical protein VKN17_05880 [Cyanobacteriota bacterium]|jgi:hypothetical protein|nr:hypothetical protein [Synechococcus sp. FGCU3]MEB3105292.1 hypothetical protein [Cyanobacteriota bacterium]
MRLPSLLAAGVALLLSVAPAAQAGSYSVTGRWELAQARRVALVQVPEGVEVTRLQCSVIDSPQPNYTSICSVEVKEPRP